MSSTSIDVNSLIEVFENTLRLAENNFLSEIINVEMHQIHRAFITDKPKAKAEEITLALDKGAQKLIGDWQQKNFVEIYINNLNNNPTQTALIKIALLKEYQKHLYKKNQAPTLKNFEKFIGPESKKWLKDNPSSSAALTEATDALGKEFSDHLAKISAPFASKVESTVKAMKQTLANGQTIQNAGHLAKDLSPRFETVFLNICPLAAVLAGHLKAPTKLGTTLFMKDMDILTALHAYFKQMISGNNNSKSTPPSKINLLAYKKWIGWELRKDYPRGYEMYKYCELVLNLLKEFKDHKAVLELLNMNPVILEGFYDQAVETMKFGEKMAKRREQDTKSSLLTCLTPSPSDGGTSSVDFEHEIKGIIESLTVDFTNENQAKTSTLHPESAVVAGSTTIASTPTSTVVSIVPAAQSTPTLTLAADRAAETSPSLVDLADASTHGKIPDESRETQPSGNLNRAAGDGLTLKTAASTSKI